MQKGDNKRKKKIKIYESVKVKGEKISIENQIRKDEKRIQANLIDRKNLAKMSGRPRTTSFAEGNKQQPQVLGGMKVTSKYLI